MVARQEIRTADRLDTTQTGNAKARLGIALMLVSIFLFSLNDVLGKWLVSTYSVGQLLLIRSAAALAVLSPFLWRTGWRPLVSVEQPGLHAARVAMMSVEIYAFYFAVGYM